MDPGPIFLIGFMAAGKSTVGPILAERLGRRWVDLDERVAAEAGKAIPVIFQDEGELGFRRREAEALRKACADRDVVVSCGGGAPVWGDNLARMRAAGTVAALLVNLDEVIARAGADVSSRPLLTGDRAQAERLLDERQAIYRSAEVTVETGGRPPAEIASELARLVPLRAGDVTVRLGERSYPVHLAPLARAGELARELLPGSIAVVTDENVARAGHARTVRAALEAAGRRVFEVVMPPGEAHKTLSQAERVASACVAGGLDRRGAIVAVGGGVVGDLAGFVASMLFRGVAVAQVPTTLLAMVDSAIGGKTGVDLPAGKNLAGAFWQPRFVLCDPATLATLPRRELVAAHAEVLKYALLGDPSLFERLCSEGVPPVGDGARFADLVRSCAAHKAAVVSSDERELTGARATLNLGHTVGHAIEHASGYALLHGEAVGLGLVAAARISARLGLAPGELPARVTAALERCGLDADLAPWLRPEVLAHVGVDKKRAGNQIRFIALEEVGRPRPIDLDVAELPRLLLGGTNQGDSR